MHTSRISIRCVSVCIAAAMLIAAASAADDKKPAYPKAPDTKNVAVTPDGWKKASAKSLSSADLDLLLQRHFKEDQLNPAPKTTDEQFIRRATIDLIGKIPSAEDVQKFVAAKEGDKRSKLIEQLLDSEDFNKRWATYWREVMVAHATEPRMKRQTGPFDQWLAEQIKAKKSWGAITKDIITATGDIRYDGKESNGAIWFLLLHTGGEADNERASETSRVFMGIQISCAQCHDHPSDIWKREQFHELAAYYSRVRDRLIRENDRFVGTQLVAVPRGEHLMPDKDNPRKNSTKHPKFLTGEASKSGLDDAARRAALADLVTAKDNFWFSAAYANRIWSVLMGQGFYMPVDNLGPLQEATYPDVLYALALSFRSSDYDMRELFRVVMNSEAYQRQSRLGESSDQHLHFSGSYPTRLSADALWDSLGKALGGMDTGRFGPPRPPMGGGFGGRFGFASQFKDLFEFDPSIKPDEVEGSIPQALMLMNNPQINGRIKATGDTPLARILKATKDDDEAVKSVYLHTLARKPTNKELETCLAYIKKLNNRAEAFEDILWSLVNSTEFQTKR